MILVKHTEKTTTGSWSDSGSGNAPGRDSHSRPDEIMKGLPVGNKYHNMAEYSVGGDRLTVLTTKRTSISLVYPRLFHGSRYFNRAHDPQIYLNIL